MKKLVSLLLMFSTIFTPLFIGSVFAASDDPVQFVVDTATYLEDQTQLKVTGHYVNVGNRMVMDVSETYLEVYDGNAFVARATIPKQGAQYNITPVGSASPQYTFVLPNPVQRLSLTAISNQSKILYNSGDLATLPQGKKIYYNGVPVDYDVPPAVINGRLMVPARATFEKMGAGVEWNPDAQSITVRRDSDVVILFIGSATMTLNGKPIKLDAPAQLVDGRTLVPLRAISSALGDKIVYGPQTEIAAIYSID